MLRLPARHIPNLISIARIFLVLPVVEALLTRQFDRALVWFTVAGLSDGVDGFLARYFGWQSRLGSYLDPIADKLLLVSSYLGLAWLGLIPGWLAALVIARDGIIFLGALAYYLLLEPFDGQPSLLSKLNTFCQLLLVFVILVQPHWPRLSTAGIPTLVGAVTLTTTLSGLLYVLTWSRRYWQRRRHLSV